MQVFEIAKVRPPTENYSLSISSHFNCPWGKCAFCGSAFFHKSRKFKRRSLEEIKGDIDKARLLNDYILESGDIDHINILNAISKYPELQECIIHLTYWHNYSGASTAFLGGANPLVYKSEFLTEILNYLKETFSSIKRITSYGRTKTSTKKHDSYFKDLHDAGLDRIHIGLESGSDNVLKFINKGVSSEGHIIGGKKIKDGGISLSVYVMPGLGGKKWSIDHAVETARVINELEPDFVRLRTLEIFPITPLYNYLRSGEFEELREEEVVREIKILVENINCNTTITSDSAANLLIDVWGKIPTDKEKIIQAIEDYLSLTPEEKIDYSLRRRTEAYISQYGEISRGIERKLNRLNNIPKKNRRYYKRVENTIKFIRSRLIP